MKELVFPMEMKFAVQIPVQDWKSVVKVFFFFFHKYFLSWLPKPPRGVACGATEPVNLSTDPGHLGATGLQTRCGLSPSTRTHP